MNYTEVEIAAVVGQLAVIHKQWSHGDISDRTYQTVTAYSLKRAIGLSRYHIYNILEIARKQGLVNFHEEEHRKNVTKICYRVTSKGLQFIQRLVDEDKYKNSINFVYDQLVSRTARAQRETYHLAKRIFGEQ